MSSDRYGKRDEERRSRKLFIGGVSFDTNDEDFFKYFAQFGELEDCVLIREKDTGQSRGFGFVTYKDKKTSEQVATQQLYLDGRRLDPKPSISRYSMDQIHEHRNQTTKVFVGGLHDDTAEAELTEYFCKFGAVIEVNIMYDRFTNKPRGFGFVTFKEGDVAEKVISWTDDHIIHNKKVDCKPATARKDAFTKNKDKDMSQSRRHTSNSSNNSNSSKSNSREERWRRYHGDEQRNPYDHHRDNRSSYHQPLPLHSSIPAHSSYPPHHYPGYPPHASHSSYAYSSTHPYPPQQHHPSAAAASTQQHYPHPTYPPQHHHPSVYPHHPSYPPPTNTSTGTTSTATASSNTTGVGATTSNTTGTGATTAQAQPQTYDYSHYDPYYRQHDARYAYQPPTQQVPYDYAAASGHTTASYPYPYTTPATGVTATTKATTGATATGVKQPTATTAPRYNYYQYSNTNVAQTTGATTIPNQQPVIQQTATTTNPATNIPIVAAPIKPKNTTQQTPIPSSYAPSRGSAATNSAQSQRYTAY